MPHQVGKEFSVMADFKIPTLIRILILQRIEAMRAGGDDFLDPVPIESFYVVLASDSN
jgi:hypothetical protein